MAAQPLARSLPAAAADDGLEPPGLGGAPRARIMGARVDALTEADAVQAIVRAAAERRGSWTITANLDHLRRYRREPLARTLIDRADLVLADGTPLVWASRLAGTGLPERVAGSNMVWSISEQASRSQVSVFLLGGDPGVAERAAEVLRGRFRTLAVAGTLCPQRGFESDRGELARIAAHVAGAAPQIVFVALGFPKQDVLIARLRTMLPYASFIGVGISLSFIAGELRRAPAWMRRAGLEWLYRLCCEPRRLLRRYLIQGVPFGLWLLASACAHRITLRADQQLWGWSSAALARAPRRRGRRALRPAHAAAAPEPDPSIPPPGGPRGSARA